MFDSWLSFVGSSSEPRRFFTWALHFQIQPKTSCCRGRGLTRGPSTRKATWGASRTWRQSSSRCSSHIAWSPRTWHRVSTWPSRSKQAKYPTFDTRCARAWPSKMCTCSPCLPCTLHYVFPLSSNREFLTYFLRVQCPCSSPIPDPSVFNLSTHSSVSMFDW